MRTFVIGTAGHVDHGKTTLVHALTGVMTDRLPEERRRGISIELGFAPLVLDGGLMASVVDVPGHRRFVPTMIAGASGIDLVVLVVAADEGVMPQTREHLAVCELLDLKEGVVALTKIDRVDDELRALAEEDVRTAIAGRLRAEIVPCAAPVGHGIDALRRAIAARLAAGAGRGIDVEASGPRLWVDRVLRVRGAGTVITGTLVAGRVARGDALVLSTSRGTRAFVAREIHVHGRPQAHAEAATRLAINATLDARDVARGDLVTAEEAATLPTSCIDASFRGAPLRRGARVTLHVGTSSVSARIARCEPLGEAEQLVRLALDEARPIAGGERHLVRGSQVSASSGALLGGGRVLDATPARSSRGAARRELVTAVHAGDPVRVLTALLDQAEPCAADPSTTSLSLSARALAEAAARAVRSGELVRCGAGVVRRASIARLADQARRLVASHAAAAPLDRGLPLATIREQLARDAGPDVAEAAILAARARRGPDDVDAIAIEGGIAVVGSRNGMLPRDVADHLARGRALVCDSGVHGVSTARIAELLGVSLGRARAVLAALEREGAAVRAGEVWFSRALVEGVRGCVAGHLAEHGRISVIELKTICGVPRRQAILLLEHLDAAGLTTRIGDARVLFRGGVA